MCKCTKGKECSEEVGMQGNIDVKRNVGLVREYFVGYESKVKKCKVSTKKSENSMVMLT